MAFTYTENISSNRRDKVRFLLGDTKSESHLIEDLEIDEALKLYSDDVNATCKIICESIAARFARKPNIRVSNYTVEEQASIYDRFMALAKKFGSNIGMTTSKIQAAFIYPPLYTDDKKTIEEDTTLTKPLFKKGMFENPESSTESKILKE